MIPRAWALACAAMLAAPAFPAAQTPVTQPAAPQVWTLDSLERVGGHPAQVTGSPRLVETDIGRAIEFDGVDDGLFVEANPLQGLARFTIEVLFQPAAGGGDEQRFLHVEETGTGNRALVELRQIGDGRWALDTYLRHGASQLTLLERTTLHGAAGWHTAALVYDGRTMTHAVDGRPEMSGAVTFPPLGRGMTSIGVRQNRVSWFKGRIREVRITPDALPAEKLQKPPAVAGSAASPAVLPLWPEGVPGFKPGVEERLENGRVYGVRTPVLLHYPAGPTAVIVCPGGGYARLAMANEAAGLVERLRPLGVTLFVLKYRLVEYGHPAPLQDVLRAVRLVRSRALDLGIAPDRIGVLGASAGGHVAALAATLFDADEGRTGAALDATPARPDFVALLYPVITMKGPAVHADSRRNLLGEHPSPAALDRLSAELQVRDDTPPVFLVHTAEDRSVPLENSLLFFEALRRRGVPAELHLYQRGAHGFGTADGLGTTSAWTARLVEWMRAHGWL